MSASTSVPHRAFSAAAILALLCACASDRNVASSPESAFRDFLRAVALRDSSAVWDHLGPDTRAVLEARAREAERDVRDVRRPAEFLVAAWLPTESDIAAIERVASEDASVRLAVVTHMGHRSEVGLRRVDGAWVVELELSPPAPDEGST